MRCVLAVDSGGTKSDALLVREDGVALGWGHATYQSPGSGRSVVGSGRALSTIAQAMRQAMGHTSCDELIIAGIGGMLSFPLWEELKISAFRLQRVMEFEPSFQLADVEAGVVALAGTGALVFGRTTDGRATHLDGLGPLLGDYGGGYQIGLLAMRAVAKAHWHLRHQTLLTDAVLQAFNYTSAVWPVQRLVDLMLQNPDRAVVAGLAPLVNEAALAGDAIARGILEEAAEGLAETTRDLVAHLEIATDAYPLIGQGSIAARSDIYWEHYCTCVHTFAPAFTPIRFDLPPAVGMALFALKRHSATPPALLRDTLFSTCRALIDAAKTRIDHNPPQDGVGLTRDG